MTIRYWRRDELDPVDLDEIHDDDEQTDHLGRLANRHTLMAVILLDHDIGCDQRERERAGPD